MNKFHTILLAVLSIALGYSVAAKPAEASMSGVADALSRMATSLEHIETILIGAKCPREK